MDTLHSYWRSTASYRVRIALGLKQVAYRQVAHDLRVGAQAEPDFLALNPLGLLPVLETGQGSIAQSLAIIEWIEETYPQPALLPDTPLHRAHVRAMAFTIGCDIHPLNNLRVLKALRSDLAADQTQVDSWIAGWIATGFTAIETTIGRHGGAFAFGDTPTVADCCLIPQIYSARRFGVDLAAFSRIRAVERRCGEIEAFRQAAPDAQPDADAAAKQ